MHFKFKFAVLLMQICGLRSIPVLGGQAALTRTLVETLHIFIGLEPLSYRHSHRAHLSAWWTT